METIALAVAASAIVLPLLGIVLALLSKSPRQKAVARLILVAGAVPVGAICGFFLFALPSDMGWLGSLRGESAFVWVLLSAFVGTVVAPILVYRFTARRLGSA